MTQYNYNDVKSQKVIQNISKYTINHLNIGINIKILPKYGIKVFKDIVSIKVIVRYDWYIVQL